MLSCQNVPFRNKYHTHTMLMILSLNSICSTSNTDAICVAPALLTLYSVPFKYCQGHDSKCGTFSMVCIFPRQAISCTLLDDNRYVRGFIVICTIFVPFNVDAKVRKKGSHSVP